MSKTAEKTDPKLWEKVKDHVVAGDKGGKPGQWSARKAQLAVHDYKAEGGGYKGKKDPDNHLSQWTKEEWGTKSGNESGKTGERYLPKTARQKMSHPEYKKTTDKKRADTAKGKQHSKQPAAAAATTKSPFENGCGGSVRGDSSSGCGPERAVAEWPRLPARRSDIRPT